ncbi:MAG: hypothetical protein ABIX01_11370 [Chitinophagaceae bacterium]
MKYILILAITVLLAACSKDTLNSNSNSTTQNGLGGSLARFTLAGNYMYVIGDATLKTFDLTNPASPILKNSITIGTNIETIYPYKDNLFIGSQTGMSIYSITNPAAPKLAGSALHVRSCDPVVANDTAAFVTLRRGSSCGSPNDGLYLYRITNLLNPQLVNTLNLSTPYGLGLKDSTLFVCQGSTGLAVLNVNKIAAPVVLKTITGSDFRDVIPFGNLLVCYVTDGLALYDISNISNIQLIKKLMN